MLVKRWKNVNLDFVIKQIRSIVKKYSDKAYIRTLALRIIDSEQDNIKQLKKIFAWILSNVKYIKDPVDYELLQNPMFTISYKRGDCDDMTILAGSLLKSIGKEIVFVVVSTDPKKDFNHIYLYVILDKKNNHNLVVPFDITRKKFATEPKPLFNKKTFKDK